MIIALVDLEMKNENQIRKIVLNGKPRKYVSKPERGYGWVNAIIDSLKSTYHTNLGNGDQERDWQNAIPVDQGWRSLHYSYTYSCHFHTGIILTAWSSSGLKMLPSLYSTYRFGYPSKNFVLIALKALQSQIFEKILCFSPFSICYYLEDIYFY